MVTSEEVEGSTDDVTIAALKIDATACGACGIPGTKCGQQQVSTIFGDLR